MTIDKRTRVTPGLAGWCLALACTGAIQGGELLQGPVPSTLADFFQPGSQPNGEVVYESFVSSNNCRGCHAIDGKTPLPVYGRWQGSMMAQSARDPLFYACLAIANQDAPFAGDLCIRCHSAGGWVSGRSEPTDGSAMTAQDRDGVSCSVCHRMVDPVFKTGISPNLDASLLSALASVPSRPGGGAIVLDPADRRRGPYGSLVAPGHAWLHSPFHRSSELCGTCHDVNNPMYVRGPNGLYYLSPFNAPHPTADKYDMFPLERTYSEWLLSDFAATGVDMAGRFGGERRVVSTCQDCHMPITTAKGCSLAGVRTDLAAHDFSGGNAWVQDMVWNLYPLDNIDPSHLQDGKARSVSMLQRAATLELRQQGNRLKVRVQNETGHKLPSGYPEGRRMWLDVEALTESGEALAQWGRYDSLTATLQAETTRVYEIRMGIGGNIAEAVGLPTGESFHFVLNNLILKDNRIPPRGFRRAAYAAVQAAPVGSHYAEGQFWDDTQFRLPYGTSRVRVRLVYQTASREFIEFLRDENRTNAAGETLHEQWLLTGQSPPVEMARQDLEIAPFSGGDANADTRVDALDFLILMGCFAGPDVLMEECPAMDFDADDDVDLADIADFQTTFAR